VPLKDKDNWLEKSAEMLCSHAQIMRKKFNLPVRSTAMFSTTESGKDFGIICNTLDELEKWVMGELEKA
jgi:hypothetical protein